MRKSLILMLSAVLLIVASCKKDSNPQEEEAQQICSVSQTTFTSTGGDSGKALYSYNAEGKVSKVVYEGENYQETYSYTSAQLTQVVKDGNNSTTYTYALNSQGRVTNETQMAGDYKIDYTYDSEGYLTQSIRTNLSNSTTITTKYTFTGGNLTKIVTPNLTLNMLYGGFDAKSDYFDFSDSDLPSNLNSILKAYFGKGSKNLIASISYDGGVYTEGFAYEKDSNGNITKVTMKASDNKGYTLANTFNCK